MVAKINIAIKTVDRGLGRTNYLGTTLQNLARGGVFDSPHLGRFTIVDSGSPAPMQYIMEQTRGIPVEQVKVFLDLPPDGTRRTLHQNAQRAIEVSSWNRPDWSLVLEDDIDVCSDFLGSVVSWLEDHRSKNTRKPMLYSFGANYAQIGVAITKGRTFWYYPISGFYGALACAWTGRDAANLAEWLGPDPFFPSEEGHEVRSHGHDLLLAKWGAEMRVSHFIASAPCFVQHIGNDSTLGNKQITYRFFAGRHWSYRAKDSAQAS